MRRVSATACVDLNVVETVRLWVVEDADPYGWSGVLPPALPWGGAPGSVRPTIWLVQNHNVRAGAEPRPYGIGQSQARIKSKRRRRFTASRETAGGDGVLFLHRRRQSIFLIDAALRAAATLFSIVTQDGQRRILQRDQLPSPKCHVGVGRRWERRVGRNQPRRVLPANKSRFSLGRHSHFFGQGPKTWGGIYIFSPR